MSDSGTFETPGVLPAFTQPRSVIQPIVQQRREDARVEEYTAQTMRVSVDHTMVGAGELIVPIVFPIKFIEKPASFASGELLPNEPIEEQNLPTVSMVITAWDRQGALWLGAFVCFVTTGVAGQRMIVTANFEGQALRGPQGDVSPTGGGGPA